MFDIFRIVKKGWFALGHAIGWVNTRIFLTVLYVVVLGIYALMKRCTRLFAAHVPPKSSWQPYPSQSVKLEELKHPF